MNIRSATPDDAAALAQIHVDSWHAAYRGIVSDTFLAEFAVERRENGFRKALTAGSEETYVAEEDGQIVGFLTLGACRDVDVDPDLTGEIWGIYLAPACWRRGIGRLLCRYGESLLEQRGCTEAILWVLAQNQHARRFYEAVGFRPDGASKDVKLGTAMTVVRYRKTMFA